MPLFAANTEIYASNKVHMYEYCLLMGAHDSAVGLGTALEAGRSRFRFTIGRMGLFSDLMIPAAL
jgi:hypothetical protein